MTAAARWVIVAMTVCSWIAITNHCALQAMAAKGETKSACPFHSKPAKPSPKSNATECCKLLRAVPAAPAKDLAPAIIDLFPLDKPFHQIATLDALEISIAPATLDTGPPGKTSFVELRATLLAHAPPFQS